MEKKHEKLGQRGHQGSHDPILEFWDPLRISRTVETRNSKFGTQMGPWGSNEKKELGQSGSLDSIFEFWDPLRISETVKATNSKFGTHMDPEWN